MGKFRYKQGPQLYLQDNRGFQKIHNDFDDVENAAFTNHVLVAFSHRFSMRYFCELHLMQYGLPSYFYALDKAVRNVLKF